MPRTDLSSTIYQAYIPQADGGQRLLGLPNLEDKIVRGAVAEVLSAVYCKVANGVTLAK